MGVCWAVRSPRDGGMPSCSPAAGGHTGKRGDQQPRCSESIPQEELCTMGGAGWVKWGATGAHVFPRATVILVSHWLATYLGFKVWTSLGDVHPLLCSLASATHINPHCQLLSPEGLDLLSLLWVCCSKSRVGETGAPSSPSPNTSTLCSLGQVWLEQGAVTCGSCGCRLVFPRWSCILPHGRAANTTLPWVNNFLRVVGKSGCVLLHPALSVP